jgi:hypothetical protein
MIAVLLDITSSVKLQERGEFDYPILAGNLGYAEMRDARNYAGETRRIESRHGHSTAAKGAAGKTENGPSQ